MFFFYQLIVSIILLFSPIIILYRIIKGKEHKRRFLEKFSFATKKRKKGNLIWFHGASVGELMSIIPVIKRLEKNKKVKKIIVTSSTTSSAKIFKNHWKSVYLAYLGSSILGGFLAEVFGPEWL